MKLPALPPGRPSAGASVFVAMAAVCLATVAVGVVRISAAERNAEAAHREAEAVRQANASAEAGRRDAEKDLQAALETPVAVDPSSLAGAFAGIGDQTVDLRQSGCQNSKFCDLHPTATLALRRCGGSDQVCVSPPSWLGEQSSAVVRSGDVWRATGTAGSGTIVCGSVPETPIYGATWTFAADVTAAQYSIAKRWRPTAFDATFALAMPSGGTCNSSSAQWSGSVKLT